MRSADADQKRDQSVRSRRRAEGQPELAAQSHAQRQLLKIKRLCDATIYFNAGADLDDLTLDLETFDAHEARVVVDARYARSKHWKQRFGHSLDPRGEKSWLQAFFANPFRKMSADLNTRNGSASGSQANLAKRTVSPMPNIHLKKKRKDEPARIKASAPNIFKRDSKQQGEAKEPPQKKHPLLADIEDKNEKMVEIIKMVNRELADFIEKETRTIMLRNSLKRNDVSAEARERVLEQEIGINEEIQRNLEKERNSLLLVEARVAADGYTRISQLPPCARSKRPRNERPSGRCQSQSRHRRHHDQEEWKAAGPAQEPQGRHQRLA